MAKILLVDDSKLYARMIGRELEKHHEIIATAHSGPQALDVLQTQTPDLILLDVTMPEMSGKECLEKILEHNDRLKVIMLTAVQNNDMKDRCLDIGAKRYLNKKDINGEEGLQSLLTTISEVHQAA